MRIPSALKLPRVRGASSDFSDNHVRQEIDFFDPPATVECVLCSAAFHESDCAVTDCSSHAKRVSLLLCNLV